MNIIKNYDYKRRYVKGVSDYPYSYMMGLAGDISFFCDAL